MKRTLTLAMAASAALLVATPGAGGVAAGHARPAAAGQTSPGTAAPPDTAPAGPTDTSSTPAPTGTTNTSSTPTTTQPAPAPRTPATRYRVVGCSAHGPQRTIDRVNTSRRVVAIGFDDGPARDTAAFVSMLERERVQATFFMIGEQVTPSFRPLLMRELRDGDALGDHSYTHPFLTRVGDVRGELLRTLGRIRSVSGYSPCIFRPPYGDVNAGVVATARSLSLATVTWDVDPSDYRLPGTDAIVQRVLSGVHPGSIILSHDGGGPRGQTLAAYPRIIAGLRAKGYKIETIPQLLGFRDNYQRCAKLCGGIGVSRDRIPAGSIVNG